MAYAQLYCSKEHFDTLRSDPRLAAALRLARTVNALRALLTAVMSDKAHPPRWQRRQQLNLLLYLGATLCEALDVAADIKPLTALLTVKDKLAPFRRQPELRRLKKEVLTPLRNQVVFHFDEDVLPSVFDSLGFRNFVFASHTFGYNLDRYYELADFALIPAAFSKGEYDSFLANYQTYLEQTIRYAKEYCGAVDEVLVEVAQELGFKNRLKEDGDTSWT